MLKIFNCMCRLLGMNCSLPFFLTQLVLIAITCWMTPYSCLSQVSEPEDWASLFPKQYVDKKPVPYVELRESNMMWMQRVWREVDMRKKVNLGFYFPVTPSQGRISFLQVIMRAIELEQIHAYAAFDSAIGGTGQWDDSFTLLLSAKEAKLALSYMESVEVENNMGEVIIKEVISRIGWDEITSFRLKEEIFFDKERSVLETRILGIAPLIPDKNSVNGTAKKEAFWVYFPEARKVFATMLFFNTQNDVMQLTYDELFMKRKFQSNVIKVSNVYDRYLDQYMVPLEALLEAEKIESEIFSREHDLWSY